MGMWEVAHEVRHEVNYVLASESWDWTSFAYDAHLAGISSTPWCWQKLGGLSIYTPLGEDENKRGLYPQLQAGQTKWGGFLAQYWDNKPVPAIQGCLTDCALPDGVLTITYAVYLPVVQR